MASVTSKILAHAKSLPEGETISARELLHLGTRPSIDQAFSRLTRKGKLLRITCGLYVLPVQTSFGKGPPSLDLVLASIKRKTGEKFAPAYIVSANRLRLTTQNPVRFSMPTSGPNRKLWFGKLLVKLIHAPSWQLVQPNAVPGHVIRALLFMGRHQADWVIEKLSKTLSDEEKRAVLSYNHMIPPWMSKKFEGLTLSSQN